MRKWQKGEKSFVGPLEKDVDHVFVGGVFLFGRSEGLQGILVDEVAFLLFWALQNGSDLLQAILFSLGLLV